MTARSYLLERLWRFISRGNNELCDCSNAQFLRITRSEGGAGSVLFRSSQVLSSAGVTIPGVRLRISAVSELELVVMIVSDPTISCCALFSKRSYGRAPLARHMNIPLRSLTGERAIGTDTEDRYGATGTVMGPHLYFEIRKDGTPINRLNYCTFPQIDPFG
jgi:hypothetical protein